MTTVQLSPEAEQALNEIAHLRGISLAEALAEAIGVEKRLAEEWGKGTDVVLVNGKHSRKLEEPARA